MARGSMRTVQQKAPALSTDIVEESKQLFARFVTEHVAEEGLDIPDYVLQGDLAGGDGTCDAVDGFARGYKTPAWAEAGRNLRKVAQEFAKSRSREKVRRQAQNIKVDTINKEEFLTLLQELFSDGCSRECIVALFFFCSDLAVCVLKNWDRAYFKSFFSWSMGFVTSRVAQFVQDRGGWCAVLDRSIDYVTKLCIASAALAITIAAVVYVRKNL